MILLYSKKNDEQQDIELSLSDNKNYSYKVYTPNLLKTGLDNSERLKRILWYLITKGRLRIFYILDGNNVAHYSFITPRNFRFPFMKQGDFQIGPCYTFQNYRGQGLYYLALKLIPSLFSDNVNTFWIYTTENNEISQHVIKKAGFKFYSQCKIDNFRVLRKIDL